MDEEKQTAQFDEVRCPAHYAGDGEVDCKRAMRSMAAGYDKSTASTACRYWAIAAFKYLWRWPLKGKPLEDLRKARECIDLAIGAYEAKPECASTLNVIAAPGSVSFEPLREWDSLSMSGTVKVTDEDRAFLDELAAVAKRPQGLKPCPFCGADPDMVKFEHAEEPGGRSRSWYVECANDSCGVNPVTDVRGSRESAAELWNGRPCGC